MKILGGIVLFALIAGIVVGYYVGRSTHPLLGCFAGTIAVPVTVLGVVWFFTKDMSRHVD